VQVTVFCWGSACTPLRGGPAGPLPWETDGRDCPSVIVDVDADETLGSVVNRAAATFGISVEPRAREYYSNSRDLADVVRHVVGIILPKVGQETPELDVLPDLDVLDARGRVHFSKRFQEVTYAELLRSIDADLVTGDPGRLYFPPAPNQGGSLVEEVLAFALTLEQIAAQVVLARDVADSIGWLKELGTRIVSLLRRNSQTVREAAEPLAEAGFTPAALDRLLRKPRSSAAVAEMLQLTPKQARGPADRVRLCVRCC
jgi:hypothetical protein